MLSDQGIVKIIDFGIAGVTVQKFNYWEFKTTVVGKKAGTFLYKPPEILCAGNSPVTSASDIYALGLIMN